MNFAFLTQQRFVPQFSVRLPSVYYWMCIGWIVFQTTGLQAVEVSDPRWGFDGKVRASRFNLLTVTVDNPAPVAVEFDLVLRKSSGAGTIDAPLVEQKIYLAPGARRIVQFYPYITRDWNRWQCTWERKTLELPEPRVSRHGARVLLDATDVLGDSKSSIKRFPEAMFPPFETATDGLQAVILDHDPNWDEPRRVAFLDWVYRGGTVFLIQGANGKFPEFAAAMSPLNSPVDNLNFGTGVVRKLPLQRQQLNRETLRGLWRQFPNQAEVPPEQLPNQGQPHAVADLNEDDEEDQTGYGYGDGGEGIHSRSFLDELKAMTNPVHNWLLLHLMFWVYIVLVFPGAYLIGLKRNDFRVVYFALGAMVLVFSLAFGFVGRRGYGERTMVNTVAIVQPLPNGFLDVAAWSNLFVTSGSLYDIHHPGSGTLYSACQDSEAVHGSIENGGKALFRVDIPPYSSREFAQRNKVPGRLPEIQVQNVVLGEGTLRELTLTVDETFPQAEVIHLLYRDRFYTANLKDRTMQLVGNVGGVPAFLNIEQHQNYYPRFNGMNDDRTPEARYQSLLTPLETRALDIRTMRDALGVRWNEERVRLMYYADLLPELTFPSKSFPQQKGKALYCIDVPLTVNSSPNVTE